MRKQKLPFLCTQNSARNQRAEAFQRHHAGDRFEEYSAGCAFVYFWGLEDDLARLRQLGLLASSE
jgi:hypothetical protein